MFFDRPDSGEVSILVHLIIDSENDREDPAEFEELAISAGAQPVDFITGSRKTPSPNLFIGSGKLEEIQAAVFAHKARLVLFNHTLSPSQERNLEAELKCRVLDRTGLILDIFAQRARSHEGKLQVELAQLQHLSTRLKRGWTHLDRQKGGIGMRGAGEKQLELDQRMRYEFLPPLPASLLAGPALYVELERRVDLPLLREKFRKIEPLGTLTRANGSRDGATYVVYLLSDPPAPPL